MAALADNRAEPRGNMLYQQIALTPQPGDLFLEAGGMPGMVRSLRSGVAIVKEAEAVEQRLQFPPFKRKHRNLL